MKFSPHESEPLGWEELTLSEAVLSSLMGEGRCHGEDPRLPSRLPLVHAVPLLTAAPGAVCGTPP